ncbi:holin [Pectobacterium parvum]|uniref:holin n=1 Tax=Pectobacterium TaxID=122277 RepID=UPI0013FD6393|nr:holin [Pectobacterium polaris]
MPNGETSFFTNLLLVGAAIGLGKLLVSEERITFRLLVGRIILGSAASMVAGVALIQFPELPELAVLGLASALGIAGSTAIEAIIERKLRASRENS